MSRPAQDVDQEGEIGELLLGADRESVRVNVRPPRVVDLERRHRSQVLRRAGALGLCLAAAATAHWSAGFKIPGGADPAQRSAEALRLRMDDSLASLGEAVAKLRSLRVEPAPSAALESTAIQGFRALQRGAASGDEEAVLAIAWIAESFPRTHGGRCARAFLEGEGGRATAAAESTQPRNDR